MQTNFSIEAKDLGGLKFFKQVRPFLEMLQSIGTARDKAKQRDLTMDQYGVLVLMWLFNPILTSLRGLQQANELEAVQRKFGVGRASLGSLSEPVTVFDPEPLKQIAATLATKVPQADPSRFDAIGKQLTAVDGSVFKTAVRVAALAWLPSKGNGKNKSTPVDGYRMHTHFEILRGVPERIAATAPHPSVRTPMNYKSARHGAFGMPNSIVPDTLNARSDNRHLPLPNQQHKLNQKLRGHYAYYGVTGNSEAMNRFRQEVENRWRKWLNRRSNIRSMHWAKFCALLRRYPLAPARAVRSTLRQAANP